MSEIEFWTRVVAVCTALFLLGLVVITCQGVSDDA